jgi:hypothetical protein
MRSLTQCSADVRVVIPVPSTLATPLISSSFSTHTHPPTHQVAPVLHQLQSTTSSPDHQPFFDVVDETRLLSLQSRSHVSQAIQSGWANSTIKRYSGAIKQYIRFCDDEGIPDHLRFPADEFVLCAFAASSIRRHARSTPSNRLSALKAWHIAHNMEWRGSVRLRYVLNGVHNLAPGSSRRPLRPPINVKMISQLLEHLDLDSPLDVAVAACATTAFWGQCRLGELLPSSQTSLQATPLPVRSGFRRSTRNTHSFTLQLPRTKTHCHGQEVVLVSQKPAVNPIAMLHKHLSVNDMPGDTHLFSYISDNTFFSLTKPVFLRRCNEIWHSLGYPRTTGHCFRIGGTTELLIAGTPPDVVKATGRWSSDSFMRYWRSLDDIAPHYIRHLHLKKPRRRRR